MSSPEKITTISFTDSDFDPLVESLGTFATRLPDIVYNQARDEYGDTALKNPTDIKLTPTVSLERPMFVIEAWHDTSSEHATGRLQYHSFVAVPELKHNEMRLVIDESDRFYTLTDHETQVILALTSFSLLKIRLEQPPGN